MIILEPEDGGMVLNAPYCGSSDAWRDGATPKGARKYQCKACGSYFNDLTKTIFEYHRLLVEEMYIEGDARQS